MILLVGQGVPEKIVTRKFEMSYTCKISSLPFQIKILSHFFLGHPVLMRMMTIAGDNEFQVLAKNNDKMG